MKTKTAEGTGFFIDMLSNNPSAKIRKGVEVEAEKARANTRRIEMTSPPTSLEKIFLKRSAK
jgi:hypothetical protein